MNLPERVLQDLYGESDQTLKKQQKRYKQLIDIFKEKFAESEHHFFSTPGRTEIGGNHTDHNHGCVLAASINLDSIAVAAKSNEQGVQIFSEGYDEPFKVDLNQLNPQEADLGTTTALIRGIASRLNQLGYKIGGFNACITSDVLPGSGLSSSASIEVLIGTIFNTLFNENRIPPETLAIIGQYAENEYFGKPCGLMDQLACAVGGIISIDFENPASPLIKRVDFNLADHGYTLAVVDTDGNHVDLTEDYASIPNEMKAVAQVLGKKVSREISRQEVINNIVQIREKVGDRAVLRALHFFSENSRVNKQVKFLEENNLSYFLKMIKNSGNSSCRFLQNIYSTKNVKEQGLSLALELTEFFLNAIGEGACRVHGGGFAGTIQVFLPKKSMKHFIKYIEPVFGKGSVILLQIRQLGTINLDSVQ